VSKLKNGTKAFIKMGLLKQGYIPQEEAEARAAICVDCPENNADSTSLLIVLMEKVTNRTTRFEDKLGVCMVCGCVLNTLVHATEDLVDTSIQHPQKCWKNKLTQERLCT